MMRILLANVFLLLLVSSCTSLQNKNESRTPQGVSDRGDEVLNNSIFLSSGDKKVFISLNALRRFISNRVYKVNGKRRGFPVSRYAVYRDGDDISITKRESAIPNVTGTYYYTQFPIHTVDRRWRASIDIKCQISADIVKKNLFALNCESEGEDIAGYRYSLNDFEASFADLGIWLE